jgi:hypothetical protein
MITEEINKKLKEWSNNTPSDVGVGYGFKQTNGIYTGEVCIVFSVKEKKPLSDLSDNEILPSEIIISENKTLNTDVIQVAGSDRIPEFSMLVNKYNGTPDQSGKVAFNFNVFEFVSAGERDPDSEGVEGMSASKLRQLAINGEVEEFKNGMASSVPDELKMETYELIRKILGNK